LQNIAKTITLQVIFGLAIGRLGQHGAALGCKMAFSVKSISSLVFYPTEV